MSRIHQDEKVLTRFPDGTIVIKIKQIDGKGTTQYRTFHVCERCGMKVRLNKQPKESNHTCQAAGQKTLNYFFKGFNNTQLIFYKTICKTNMSLHAAASKQFEELLRTVFSKGQESILTQLDEKNRKNIRIPNINEYLKLQSRQSLARQITATAENLREVTYSNLLPFKYISLCLDGGTINSVPVLDIIVQNPFYYGKPLLVEARSRFSGTRACYIEIVTETIKKHVVSHDLIITSFVGDNLVAQKAAFDDKNDSVIKKKSLKEVCGAALYFPCSCHVVALGFSDCVAETNLDNIQDDLRELCKMFRSKTIQQYFSTLCPPFCPTRWTNCFSISKWFIDNRNDIVNMFKTNNERVKAHMKNNPRFPQIFVEDMPIFYSLLYCYNSFITALEGDHVPGAYVFPLFHSFKDSSFQVISAVDHLNISSSLYIRHLVDSISGRLASMYTTELLKFLWFLTPAGRLQAREEMLAAGFEIQRDVIDQNREGIGLQFPKIQIDIDEMVKYLRCCIADLNSIQQEIQQSFNTVLNSSTSVLVEDDYEEEISEEPLDSCVCTGFGTLDCNLVDVLDVVDKRAKAIFPSDPIKVVKIASFFQNWLKEPINRAWQVALYAKSPWHYWKETAIHDPVWKDFADFALRHLAIVSNSASVERAFWREARQVPPDRAKTSDELLISRLLLCSLD